MGEVASKHNSKFDGKYVEQQPDDVENKKQRKQDDKLAAVSFAFGHLGKGRDMLHALNYGIKDDSRHDDV